MFSKLFGRGKKGTEESSLPQRGSADFSFLGADMHSHFIPGIDDGAKTIEDSLYLIRSMAEMGYKSIITTPHIMADYYKNTPQIINDGLDAVKSALKENNIEVGIRAAAEYYIDEHFIHLMETEPLLTVYQKEVLVECSMLYEPPNLIDVLFNMITAGYRPIFAHPERYLFLHNRFDRYQGLKDRGCLLQLNMLSLTGYYGRNIKLVAEDLLAKGLYDYVGTDTHHEKHAQAIKNITSSKVYDTLKNYPFLNKRLCF